MPLKTSWVATANSAETPFPLNNLPYGVFSTDGTEARCGVAIGDMILDMAAAEESGLVALADDPLFDVPYWNDLMAQGPAVWAALRERLTALRSVWAVLLLFFLVIGGLYGAFDFHPLNLTFSPTEAAGMGAMGAFLIALSRGGLSIKSTFEVLKETTFTAAA